MRYSLLFLLFLFFFSTSRAQIPLDGFYKDGTVFTGYEKDVYDSHSPPNHNNVYTTSGYEILINSDTTISGITYRKLYLTSVGGFHYSDYSPNPTFFYRSNLYYYIGRLRVDSRKVFITMDYKYSGPNIGKELLMYDFGKQIGDSVEGTVITTIDSIQLNTGDYVKRFSCIPNSTYSYAEGIGSAKYALMPYKIIFWGPGPSLMDEGAACYRSGPIDYHYPYDHSKYDWKLMDNCFDMNALTVEKTQQQKQLTLYPNPSNGSVTIEGSLKGNNANINIFNTLGQVVYSSQETINNTILHKKMDLKGIPAGIYKAIIQTEIETKTAYLTIQ